MATSNFLIFLYFLGISALAYAQNDADTLVLLDTLATRETHITFFKEIQGKQTVCRYT